MREKRVRRPSRPLWQTAAEAVGAEGDLLARIPVIVVRAMREAEITGCVGILDYGPERVALQMEREVWVLTGEGLTLEDFRDGTITVRGLIRGMRLGGEEER